MTHITHTMTLKLTCCTFILSLFLDRHDPQEASRARIKHVVETISTYPNEVFESFFWANKNVSSYLERMCSQRRLDSLTKGTTAAGDGDGALLYLDTKRHATWSTLFAHLKSHVAPSPLPRELLAAGVDNTKTLSQKDPCQFRRMVKEMHTYTDKVVFPMEYLQSYRDEKLASACLAFLGARLAMPTLLQSGHQGSDIFHVALEFGPSLYNNRARSIPQSMTSAQTPESMPYTQAGIRGAGQVVGVADTGIDRSSCYFEDPAGMVTAEPVPSKSFDPQYRKVIQYVYIQGQADDKDTVSGHGTHVAGTVAGSVVDGGGGGGGDAVYDGAAPDAKLAFLDMTSSGDGGLAVPDSAADLYSPSYAAGARLHSNSWGSNHQGQGYYTNSDSDGWLYDNQDYLAIYAAGNNGGSQSYLTSQESQGKNCMSVGAGESPSSIASFSSVGPAYDNRIKPDIVLPGSGTISAEAAGGSGQPSCATGPKSGTSMATPAASGNGALIRDYLATKWSDICMDPGVTPDDVPGGKEARCANVDNPTGVLIKAILLHGGRKMDSYAGNTQLGDAPDSKQGYGILYLGNVLPLPAADLTFGLFVHDSAEIGSDESVTYTVKVTDATKPLKVTLSWYDPANQNGISTTALLHDLDLSVTSKSGTAYWGNHLSEAGNKPDRLNNNEQVMIASPDDDTWIVKVATNSLVKAQSQKYSLVITNGGYAYKGDDEQQPAPPPAPATTQAPTSSGEPGPAPAPVPAPAPDRTALPTIPKDKSPPDDPPEPPKWADDDHFHHRHPGNDDWHSHKRNPDKEDDYIPPGKENEKESIAVEDHPTHDLSHFEKRLINAIRGVFAAPAVAPN